KRFVSLLQRGRRSLRRLGTFRRDVQPGKLANVQYVFSVQFGWSHLWKFSARRQSKLFRIGNRAADDLQHADNRIGQYADALKFRRRRFEHAAWQSHDQRDTQYKRTRS